MSAMKLRGHLGLIELFNISSSVKTSLGPRKSYKFIYDQDTQESTLICSSFRLLENLDLSSAVGQLFNETIQAHHKAYKTGTTTLFFLVGVWSKAVLDCLHQGVPVSLIVSIMIEGLNSCIDSVEALHIPLFNVVATKKNSSQSSSVVDGRTGYVSNNQNYCFSSREENFGLESQGHVAKTIKHAEITVPSKGNLYSQKCQRSKLSSSRHFSKIRHFQNPSQSSSHSLEDLTKSLSHGYGEVMELVEKAATLLSENAQEISVTKDLFQASCLNICFLRGLSGLSDVNSNPTSGYVTFLRPEYATIVQDLEGKPLKVLLLDGELTENYRHLGFNKSTGLKSVSEFENYERRTSEELWTSKAYQRIVQANIDLILVKGDACPQLVMQCMHRNILIITHVKPNILQAFSECTGAEQVAYLTQVSHRSIGCEVYAKICPQWSSESSHTIAVGLCAHRMNLVTVMLSCRLIPKMQVMEDQFWACSYKLHNALLDQKVFPGGGAVELLCLNHLRKLEERLISVSSINKEPQFLTSSWLYTSAIHYRTSVYRCLAQGWIKYLSTLLYNIGEYSSELEAMTFIQNETQKLGACSSPSSYLINEYSRNVVFVDDLECPKLANRKVMVYDNVVPKVEAWRSAVHLVLTVLQSDAEIITGSTSQRVITGDSASGDYVLL